MAEPVTSRGAGILLHITSLSSNFGSGDLGPAAYRFADFLKDARQKYWQILPLSPTESACAYSPYSSFSSMAGNTLLISPELMVADDLLDDTDISGLYRPISHKADFEEAEKIRTVLLDLAYYRFHNNPDHALQKAFKLFCEEESYWLNDFALYEVIKGHYQGLSWRLWDSDLKNRKKKALTAFNKTHKEEILKSKFRQFVFFAQWKKLKDYCNASGILILGDMPFYVSHNSADVWINPQIFQLDEQLEMAAEAGVPPDYFNADGQLWRMPVFNWARLKKTHYSWWIQRIRKNTELFDLLRFDHFRAFSAYWEIPAGESTARNGSWKKGPGEDFFDEVKKQLGELPFIAEDLGDIDQAVYELRDKYALPGMKVLQFAFTADMATSVAIPHRYTENSVVYTGTHDNNTTVGWFSHDASALERSNLASYTGKHVKADNVHHIMARLAYGSVSKIAILPMQDVIGMGGDCRMNVPATENGNWRWRMPANQPGNTELDLLKYFVNTFGRW